MMGEDRWHRRVPLPSRVVGDGLMHGPGNSFGRMQFEAMRRLREEIELALDDAFRDLMWGAPTDAVPRGIIDFIESKPASPVLTLSMLEKVLRA